MNYPFGLRAMSAGMILDHSFRIYRRNFKQIALFSLLIGGLGQLLAQAVLMLPIFGGSFYSAYGNFFQNYLNMFTGSLGEYGSTDPSAMFQSLSTLMVSMSVGLLIQALLSLFVIPLVTGGITDVAGGYYHGITDSAGGWFRRERARYGKLVLTGLARLLGLAGSYTAAIIPILIVYTAMVFLMVGVFAAGAGVVGAVFIVIVLLVLILAAAVVISWVEFIFPVAIVEGKLGFSGLGRAFRLYFSNFWRMLGIVVLAWCVVGISGLIVTALSTVMTTFLHVPLFAGVLLNVLFSALTAPIMPIVMTLAYLSNRIRREGYDLALRQRDQMARPSPSDGPRS